MQPELESPLKTPTQEEIITVEFKTPPQDQKIDQSSRYSGNDLQIKKSPQNPQIDQNTPENIPTPAQDQKIDQNSRDSSNDLQKTCIPDRLKLPKAFKYPERYRSPTDAMMSPVTKGLLARNRRTGSGVVLPPSLNHSKIQEVNLFQN